MKQPPNIARFVLSSLEATAKLTRERGYLMTVLSFAFTAQPIAERSNTERIGQLKNQVPPFNRPGGLRSGRRMRHCRTDPGRTELLSFLAVVVIKPMSHEPSTGRCVVGACHRDLDGVLLPTSFSPDGTTIACGDRPA